MNTFMVFLKKIRTWERRERGGSEREKGERRKRKKISFERLQHDEKQTYTPFDPVCVGPQHNHAPLRSIILWSGHGRLIRSDGLDSPLCFLD
jgi:hypothetical protein